MSVKKVKLHFDATINEEDGTMEMGIHWESSVEYAVSVLCTAAEKHPQIYEAIVTSAGLLVKTIPKSVERRMAELMVDTLNTLDEEELTKEEVEAIKRMNMMGKNSPQGNA